MDSTSKILVPKAQSLPALQGRNGLSSAGVVVLDSKTIMIRDFVFKAMATGEAY